MDISFILNSKELKAKEKVSQLAEGILQKQILVNEIIEHMHNAKDPIKGSCIEALEYATEKQSDLLDIETFLYITSCLKSKAPRIKWESAKVLGNTANHFPELIQDTISKLLENAKHEGTVVRWSVAYALKSILENSVEQKQEWKEQITLLMDEEEKNSIKKMYKEALK